MNRGGRENISILDTIRDFFGGLFAPKRVATDGSSKLYVGNLNYNAKDEDIKRLFSTYGQVAAVHLVRDRRTKKPKGFAFVEMVKSDEMQKALKLGGTEFMGRKITVSIAKSHGPRFRKPFRGDRPRYSNRSGPRRSGGGNGGNSGPQVPRYSNEPRDFQ